MIDPLFIADQNLAKIFKFRFSLDMVKDDWPPFIADQNLT